ncbi:hypothetical protein Tsubulata_004902 [Turnera subulata]|uniref:KIB1-4 beta-propeller domain-containing protein n=1 Tax=Turnera subulata TaxID=218843 RepID=A0A9Q0G1R1_9ROSI|nr:hypothetical protein Tsubulata_004902 [Turnera subulata]
MDSNNRQWTTLLSDLLRKIAGCLDSRLDILRFRWVCHSWRSSVPLPLPPPVVLKLPYPIGEDTNPNTDLCGHCILSESYVLSIQPRTALQSATTGTSSNTTATTTSSTTPWIVRIQFSESVNLVFKDLFSSSPVHDVDKRRLPKVLDLADYEVNELCRAYELEFVDRSGRRPCSGDHSWSTQVRQVVISGKIGDGFTVMVLKNDGKLAVWRMGDDKWIDVGDQTPEGSSYRSTAYHRGKFYAVCDNRLTVTIDSVSLSIREVAPAKQPCRDRKVLVESSGDLLLVLLEESWVDYFDFEDEVTLKISFAIEKLDEDKHEWIPETDGLKDRLLFTCEHWSLSVSAKDFPGYEENCIYCIDPGCFESDCDHPYTGIIVHDVASGNPRPLCSSVHGCSKIFWPPPRWLKKKIRRSSK